MWSRPDDAGELAAPLTQACSPSQVIGAWPGRVSREMSSRCSARTASRAFVSGNGTPIASASDTLKPAPRPRISRPPLMASSVPAYLAVIAGRRKVELMTVKPISTSGTRAASAVATVVQSNIRAVGSHLDRTCSPTQMDPKPSARPRSASASIRSQAATGVQPSNSPK